MKKDNYAADIARRLNHLHSLVDTASGRHEADLVIKNATYVNVFLNELSQGDIAVVNGVIAGIGSGYRGKTEIDASGMILLPGFIDAHIHLESSLVKPVEFVKAVLPHGTTTVVTDPHEIANVMGTEGIDFMLQATQGLPVDVRLMLPSCVPATALDESGAILHYQDIERYFDHDRVLGLAEMMDYPGVIHTDREVLEKLASAQAHHKRIDGHAPKLTGQALNAYVAAGIYSDHECSNTDEALEKLSRGQYIMIRQGTAARNLDALMPLLTWKYCDRCMFCTDDINPSDLLARGDIDAIIRRALKGGVDPIIAVKCATLHTAQYFGLNDRGAIAPGYAADFVCIDGFDSFDIRAVYKGGRRMVHEGELVDIAEPQIDPKLFHDALNTFHMARLTGQDLVEARPRAVLGMIPGEIITRDVGYADKIDVEKDILKIIVAERHNHTRHIGIGYIQGYGLRRGAVATSISHDSHNIIAVGVNEAEIAAAVNRVIELHGGIVVWDNDVPAAELSLEIAGIMSQEPLKTVDRKLEAAKAAAYALGVHPGVDPFMTLSFMALPVIPSLRLTTRGMFDVTNQRFV